MTPLQSLIQVLRLMNVRFTVEVRPSGDQELHFENAGRKEALLFDAEGVPQFNLLDLATRMSGAGIEVTAVPVQEAPTTAKVFSYDVEKHGKCTDDTLCSGLVAMLEASCMEHGGIFETTSTKGVVFIGFVPPHALDETYKMRFCPACGAELKDRFVDVQDPDDPQPSMH